MPVTMLLATPFLLHQLGVASYGLWMLTTCRHHQLQLYSARVLAMPP